MTQIRLPKNINGTTPRIPEGTRQLTIIGAAGAGKSRFMQRMRQSCGELAYSLSALDALLPSPAGKEAAPGSIDDLYNQAIKRIPYMRNDAMSQLDKLAYMLFADEFESLLKLKEEGYLSHRKEGIRRSRPQPTRLDRLKGLWEKIFPGNKILRRDNTLMFTTGSGSDAIGAETLSQSESAVLYYIAAVLYAMPGAVVLIDSPTLFLHPASLNTIWNSIEQLRPDCTFVYNTVDADFVNSRTQNATVWVKSYDVAANVWDYELLRPGETREDMLISLAGTRNPVLFIEGDAQHSIDARLYTLVFSDYTVRPLGSCDRVIETTRTFSSLKSMHHLDSHGIVDRDRRTDAEVEYLRKRGIMVPEVAEVENIFLAEDVIKTMAALRGKNASRVFENVKGNIMKEFRRQLDSQALQHVRHRMKRLVECRIDGRFNCITALETHIKGLINILNPRKEYNQLRQEFQQLTSTGDYQGVIRVFNHKPALSSCGVAQALGYKTKEDYVAGVLATLKRRDVEGRRLADAIRALFR